MYEAIAASRWSDCIAAATKIDDIAGRPFASRQRLKCWQARINEEGSKRPNEFWLALYRVLTLEVQASKYAPGYLDVVRPGILAGMRALEQQGLRQYADDLKLQLQTIAVAPRPEPAPKHDAVQSFTRSGTAFVVRPDGFLITAFHVVQDAATVRVACPGKQPIPVGIEVVSQTTDLAVLRTQAVAIPDYLSFSDPLNMSVGARVFTVGYPAPELLGSEVKFTEGVVSSLSGPDGDASFAQTTVASQPGNSGGPLVNEEGEVVGIVIATASAPRFLKATGSLPQNVNWAVKGSYATAMFVPPPKLKKSADRASAIQRAINATCFVIADGERPVSSKR
jgi:S1-C subfamily serine protease